MYKAQPLGEPFNNIVIAQVVLFESHDTLGRTTWFQCMLSQYAIRFYQSSEELLLVQQNGLARVFRWTA